MDLIGLPSGTPPPNSSARVHGGLIGTSRKRQLAAAAGALIAALTTAGCAAAGGSPAATTTPATSTAPLPNPEYDFLFQTRTGGDGLGVFVSQNGELTRVDASAPGNRHKHPIWTNDGSRVAFVAEGEWDASGAVLRSSEVWTVDPSGEAATLLISCDCWDLNNPAWSPDGSKVAFAEFDAPLADGPPSASRIVVLDLGTDTRTTIATSSAGQLVDIPRWSPDGKSLVVSIDRFDDSGNETGASFAIVDTTGGDVVPMLPFEDFAYAADWNWVTGTLVFSVEAQQYASPNPEVSNWDLFEIEADGTNRRAITDVGSQQQLSLPKWSNDGALIAATLDTTADQEGGQQAVIVDPASGTITPLADPLSDYAGLRPSP